MYKILFISSFPPPLHGVSRINELIINSRIQDKFEFIKLDTSDKRGIGFMNTIDFNKFRLLVHQIITEIKILHNNKIDLVYMTNNKTVLGVFRDIIFITIASAMGKKVVVHYHAGIINEKFDSWPKILQILARSAYRKINTLIVLRQDISKKFMDKLAPKSIIVLPNAVENIPPFERNYFKPVDEINILFVSHLRKEKGYELLLKAIPLVLSKYPKIIFHFVGEFRDDTEKKFALSFVKENDMNMNVIFHGPLYGKEKDALYLNSDIFIFPPTIEEGFPLVVLEAMRAGMPIIVSKGFKIDNAIIDGVSGIYLNTNQESEIAEKILQMIENPERRKQYGEKAKQLFNSQFTLDKFISELESIFQSAIANN